MQRLLHEGMDAGLCGFSIQRLGENSTQADFDGSPDGDRHDVRRGHPRPGRGAGRARRGLHPDHPGHRRHQGRPGVRGEAGRGRPAADPPQRHRPRQQGPRDPPALAALGRASAGARACRSTARPPRCAPASPSRSSTGTSTTPARRGAPSPPAPRRRSWPRWPTPSSRQAVLDEAEEADRRLQAIQAGVGGKPRAAHRAGRERPARARAVRGPLPRRHRRGGGQAPHRGHAGPVARRAT